MNKKDKLKEVQEFIKANPGKSNRWYAANNKIISARTFFNYLKEGLLGGASTASDSEQVETDNIDLLKEAGITPTPKTYSTSTENIFFENDDPLTAKKKKREMDYEVKRAELLVNEEKRRAAAGEYVNYEDCKKFLLKYFSFDKAKRRTIRQHIEFFLKNPKRVRNPRAEWFARFLTEEGYDTRTNYKVLEEINRTTNQVIEGIKHEKIKETLKTTDNSEEKVLEQLLKYVPNNILTDMSKIDKVVKDLKTSIKTNNVTIEKCLNSQDSVRVFVQIVVYTGHIPAPPPEQNVTEKEKPKDWKKVKETEGEFTINNDEDGELFYQEIISKVNMDKVLSIKPIKTESISEFDVDKMIEEYDKLNYHNNLKQEVSFTTGSREWEKESENELKQ